MAAAVETYNKMRAKELDEARLYLATIVARPAPSADENGHGKAESDIVAYSTTDTSDKRAAGAMERGGGLLTAATSIATAAHTQNKDSVKEVAAAVSGGHCAGLLTGANPDSLRRPPSSEHKSATQNEARSQAEVSLPVRVLARPLNRREELTQTMVGHSDSGTR